MSRVTTECEKRGYHAWTHTYDSGPEQHCDDCLVTRTPDHPWHSTTPIRCDQCQMCSINGIACHETGCPNERKTWIDGEWQTVTDDEEEETDY